MPKRSLGPGKNDPRKNDPRSNDAKKIEQLNRAVDALLARVDGKPPKVAASLGSLVRIATDLCRLPREEFKTRLKSELLAGRKTMSAIAEPAVAVRTTASPSLSFKNAAKAIEFYKNALGARETFRFEAGGHVAHAEMAIGDSIFMLAEEWPEGGRFSAETLGASPVQMVIRVDDVDAFAEHAVSAGLTVKRPLQDQFYGHRDVLLSDPFGYTWNVSTVKEEMSVEEMHRRMKGMTTGPEGGQMPAQKGKRPAVNPIPRGYRMVTPYLVAQDANAVIDFVKKTFAGEELFRAVGSAGGYHCEVRVEDSMLMIGGGGPGVAWKGDSMLGAFHVYVRDCDAAYKRALEA